MSCSYDAKAAAESNKKIRIKLYKKVRKYAREAYDIFSKLDIEKLKNRSKSLELSSEAWLLVLNGVINKQVINLFQDSFKYLSHIDEWKNMSYFLLGCSRLFSGIYYIHDNSKSKKNFSDAINLFNECGCIELRNESIKYLHQK